MIDRRKMLGVVAGTGMGTAVFHRALVGLIQEEAESKAKVTSEMVKTAEWISGTEFNDEERDEIAKAINGSEANWKQLREQPLDFYDLPALHFQPLTGTPRRKISIRRSVEPTESAAIELPSNKEDIAFLPVTELASLIRTKKISSMELTKIYLERLEKYNPLLNCVVTITEDLAMKQAAQADQEIAAGRYRGPLHGIPWGAKDLISVPGYPTTWGIPQFEDRVMDQTATVAARLQQAGAVLVAKLALGAIAMGDKWFRGMTRSPWDYKLGSSGSSAGSASATVAGLVGFSLGTETLGSIISPSRRCGATGFRPTFGRVSRAGCMPLSWSMDKVGPITRSIEDCALVFAAIHGYDGQDPTAHDWSFNWPTQMNFNGTKVGYVEQSRRRRRSEEEAAGEETKEAPTRRDLEILKELGCEVIKIKLPEESNQWLLAKTIDVEAASIFDSMLRDRETEGWNTWPATFRSAQFISAIDYFRIQRRRRQLQFKMQTLMRDVDFLVNCNDLLITNLTGHPSVSLPSEFRETRGRKTPVSTLLTGRLNEDDRLLALALAYQRQLTAHLERPPLDELIKAKANDEKEAAEKKARDEEEGTRESDSKDTAEKKDG